MDIGMKIGNEMHKDGVEAVADALMRMLQSGAEQKTIRCAIKAFSTLAEVKNISVSHSNIIGGDVGIAPNDISAQIKRAVESAAWGKREFNADDIDNYTDDQQ